MKSSNRKHVEPAGTNVPMSRVLPRNAVKEKTWSKICQRLGERTRALSASQRTPCVARPVSFARQVHVVQRGVDDRSVVMRSRA
jgi:hypothetical protein